MEKTLWHGMMTKRKRKGNEMRIHSDGSFLLPITKEEIQHTTTCSKCGRAVTMTGSISMVDGSRLCIDCLVKDKQENTHVGEYPTLGEAVEEARQQSARGRMCFVTNEGYTYVYGISRNGEFISGDDGQEIIDVLNKA